MFVFWGKHKYRYGLVLSGGGAKGAYQIGAFKALEELGIASRVTAISGCSIGALNALLFASGGSDLWERAWAQVNYDSFFKGDESTAKSKLGAVLREVVDRARGGGLEEFLARPPLFSQSGLEEYMRRFVPRDRFAETKLRLYSCAYNLENAMPEYFCLNDYDYDDAIRLALASSALPMIYSPVSFKGYHYCDGGMIPPYAKEDNSDKVPVNALAGEPCDIVIVLYLTPYDKVEPVGFAPETRFLELYPSQLLERRPGTGTLDLSPENLAGNQRLGYRDTMAAFCPMILDRLKGKTLDEALAAHRERNEKLLEALPPPAEK